ncbi:MAG: hypothetical protein RI980_74 [Bacteroidota bacterium]|jgi:hypothetical protein|nr:MAG: hypothetical protein EAY77_06110 [Flavobacteriia bacterium]
MNYSEQINAIYEHLKTSLSNGTFAKLTLGKTIGKTELTNIYFRTIVANDTLKFNVTFRYLSEEIIEIKPIEDVVLLLNQYLTNPFLTVILFTTEKDILIKLNKKRIATITEMDNTFKNADPVLLEYLKK